MGRVLLVILIIAAVVLLWKAFGPGAGIWRRRRAAAAGRAPKGPDDDPDFLWHLEKRAYDERREREREAERERKQRGRDDDEGAAP